MKKLIGILIALCIVASFTVAADGNNVSVTVNGAVLDFDQPPVIENGRTLVPMRAIFEALGCKVEYYDDNKLVIADKGLDTISFVIGEDTLFLNGDKEIPLDVPAKIKNNRTLIPLRAVSEALGANVEWYEAERAVVIESRLGAHKIERKLLTQRLEGKAVCEINIAYPFIEPDGNEFIDTINAEYEKEANDALEEALSYYKEIIEDEYFVDDYGIPFTMNMDYIVTLDRKGYLSILTTHSFYSGGAHPNSTMWGRTFDLKANKELTMREVFNAETFDLENAVAERIADVVLEYSDEEHAKDVHDEAIKEIDNAGFYLTDDAVHVFYVPYQIASYAEGYLTAEIYYDSEYINVDLSDYDWQELVYEIPGNRTTGFEWILPEKSDKLDTELFYIEPETNLPGAGGSYELHIKGIKPGNATIRLEYRRGWEDLPIEVIEYRFYVENDLGVTLISEKHINN